MDDTKITGMGLIVSNSERKANVVCRSSKGFDNLDDIAKIFRDIAEVSQVTVEKATVKD